MGARQYLARRGNVAGIAGKLYAVFGSAERGRANALAGGQDRPGQGVAVNARANGAAERAAESAEIAIFARIDIFRNAARKHHALNAGTDRNASSQTKA